MGQGKEVKTRDETQIEIQERGKIFFFYRPKIGKEGVHSPDDVQRLYIVLRPESGEKSVEEKQDSYSGKEAAKSSTSAADSSSTECGQGVKKVNIGKDPLLRLIVIGRKSLPDLSKRSQPYWGFIDLVTTNVDHIKNALGQEQEYETSTRGHGHVYPARALGEGIYRMLRHNPSKRMHTHLVYKLEFPAEDKQNEPQECLNVERQASFLIQIKNPEQPGSSQFRGLQNKRKATFPAHLQAQFGHRSYCPADPPDLLNYEGCEILLISASDDLEDELGAELDSDSQTDPSCSDFVRIFGDAHVATTALFQGTWT